MLSAAVRQEPDFSPLGVPAWDVGRLFVAFLLWACLAGPTQAQSREQPMPPQAVGAPEEEAAVEEGAAEERDPTAPNITPFVFPAYTPELGLLLAGGAMISFTSDRSDPDLPRSSIPLDLGVSTTKAIVSYSQITTFLLRDRLRIYATLWAKHMPDHYFGVGYHAGRNTELEEDVTDYLKTWWQVNPSFLLRVGIPGLYVGPVIDVNQTLARERGSLFATDESFQRFGANNFNAGAGLALQYDTRDFPVNAYRGIYADARVLGYHWLLGSNNDFQVVQLDYRQYQQLGRAGSTLAWQAKLRAAFGDTPYAELSQLGTPFDLRGYFWGRYRHRAMLFGLVEYRLMQRRDRSTFWRNMLTRNGLVAWVGGGSIARRVVRFHDWLPNAGVGYRLEIQPRLNVRLDAGFGLGSYAIYFNMNEAF